MTSSHAVFAATLPAWQACSAQDHPECQAGDIAAADTVSASGWIDDSHSSMWLLASVLLGESASALKLKPEQACMAIAHIAADGTGCHWGNCKHYLPAVSECLK